LSPVFASCLIDARNSVMGFFSAIHKRDSDVLKSSLKLRQNRLAEVLGSDSGAIRDDKNNASLGIHEGGLTVVVSTTIGN